VAEVYPQVLVQCIKDGRCPFDNEVEAIATKTWEEGVRFLPAGTPWMATQLVRHALLAGQISRD
ncbi:MAG: hypothetical protein ACXWIW_09090, partial [Croceibacterium sp.]